MSNVKQVVVSLIVLLFLLATMTMLTFSKVFIADPLKNRQPTPCVIDLAGVLGAKPAYAEAEPTSTPEYWWYLPIICGGATPTPAPPGINLILL